MSTNYSDERDDISSPSTAAQITDVGFSPAALNSGDVLNVAITVFNGTNETLATQGPNSGFVYDESDTFYARGYPDVANAFRVGVDFDGRAGIDHPYRWGLGAPLAPGQTATIAGAIRLKTARAVRYWAGLVREQVAWLQDRQGAQMITVNPTGPIQITNVTCTPTTLRAGEWLNISITVRNNSTETLPTQDPAPGFIYDEEDTFRSRGFTDTKGSVRVGIDFDGRDGIDHPYRWGLGAPLAPGETRTINGAIRLKTARVVDYWAGLVREQVAWLQDRQGTQTITVNPAGAVTITNITLTPTTVSAGGLLNVSITVMNDSAETLPTQGPDPGFIYDESDTFRSRGFSDVANALRVGVDFDGRAGVDHPFRWGLGAPLAPGETRTINGAIRLRTPRAITYWAGLVREMVAWLHDRQGAQTITVNTGAIKITSATLAPAAISAGNLLNVSVTVRNDSLETLETQEPDPGFVYDEGDTFRSRGFTETADAFRVAVDFDGRAGIDHPYRWGLGAPLAPGQTATITGAIRLQTARACDYWCGLVREKAIWVADQQGAQSITVVPIPMLAFAAMPATIEVGDSTTLQWTVTDASAVSLDGETVPPIGSRVVTPTQAATYTLRVVLLDGTTRDLVVMVNVVPKKNATFTVTPNSVTPGAPATLAWNTEHAVQLTLDGESVSASGTRVVTPTQTTTYTLHIVFDDGVIKDLSVTLTIEQYGLAAMSQFERLPFLRANILAGGQSSYDRTGGNADFNNFLSTDANGDVVLCDLKGPGTIYRLWVTGFNRDLARIKFYFDGETTPRVDMLMNTLFAGETAPFLSPLVDDDGVSSGGYYCYLPMSFSRGIKITANGTHGERFYYNVNYHLYPPDTIVTTWTGAEDSSAVRALWNRVTQDPKSDAGNMTVTGVVNLNIGSTVTMFELAGPRAFSSIKLRVPGVVARPASDVWDILNATWIRIYWDNESNPSVAAPLGSFFGVGQFSTYRAKSLAAGLDDSSALYIYFPMPFEKHARIELFNSRGVALNGIAYEIKHKAFDDSFARVGYFKTQFNHQVHAGGDGTDVTILDTDGTGHFVGVVLSILGEANRMYLEGDERIYIDDNRSPAIHGTGTEDFFNGGWYYRGGPFSQPVHGLAANVHDGSFDRTAQYRLFLADAIPFNRHLTVGIEHGQYNDVSEEAWALAYYYHKPTPRAVLTDTLNVGNAASESSHEYVSANATWSGTRSFSYEGVHPDAIGDDGRTHRGHSQFVMAIQPANEGVVLRRRLDYGIGNQNAEVYVDDVRVGAWYRAGSNSARWRDDDFLIPTVFTKGKNKITIRVVFVSSDSDWSEFTYWAYCLNAQ
jgi:hypothetical protein